MGRARNTPAATAANSSARRQSSSAARTDISELTNCPDCGMQWTYMAECYKCNGTGLQADGNPCDNHSDAYNEATRTFDGECTPHCCKDGQTGPFKHLIGIQYDYTNPNHYDGVSEWCCPGCHSRWGRWSGRKLIDDDSEVRFGGQ